MRGRREQMGLIPDGDDDAAIRAYLLTVTEEPGRPLVRSTGSAAVQEPLPIQWRRQLEAAFVGCAHRWAEANGVRRSTLLRFGVPASVLAAAWADGDDEGDGSGQVGRIRVLVVYPDRPFTAQELVEYTGLSLPTVGRALNAALAEGRVEELAPLQRRGPGARPRRFRAVEPAPVADAVAAPQGSRA